MAQAIPENIDQQVRQQERARKSKQMDDNVIFVGKKPPMAYVMAVMTQLSEGVTEVNIKARGRSISNAVDVAEIVCNKFLQTAKVKVEIGTDEMEGENNQKLNVSTISIVLTK